MNAYNARVSIGLPVYNGEKYLREALDSIMAQSYTDFELIISDNASTDETAAICRHYAARDRRLNYYRNDKNLGLAWNQNHVIKLSSGEYFMMASHDDVRAPEYVEQTIKVLHENPTWVLCYSKTRDIDENGQAVPREEVSLNVDSAEPNKRFRDLIRMDHICEPIFGLIRANVLKQTLLFGNYADSDRVLLAQLSLYGAFYRVPEYLFLRRKHSLQSTAMYPDRQSRTVLFDPTREGKIGFPHFREFFSLVDVIRRGPLPRIERLRCYRSMANWVKANRGRLKSDLMIGFKSVLRPHYQRIRLMR